MGRKYRKKKETGSALKWAEKNGTVYIFRAIFLRQQHVQEKVWFDFHEVGVRLNLEISRNHTRELGRRGLLGGLCRGVPKKRENTRWALQSVGFLQRHRTRITSKFRKRLRRQYH